MTNRKRKRHITVITGSRAEYGILYPVLEAIDRHPGLKLQLVVTGMHLLRRFGYTVKEIEADGWPIAGRVRLQGEKDDVIGQARGLGRAITGLVELYSRLHPDIVVVLGDRLEMFAAAAAASASRLIIAHIHGGEVAQGIQDDAYRHAISKLSHIHFAATTGAKKRLIKLGEDKFRLYQTGSPALDNIRKKICRDIDELNQYAGFDVRDDFLVILQHPAGGTVGQEQKRMEGTLRACSAKSLPLLVLYPNCDPGFSGIIQAIEAFAKHGGCQVLRHLPRDIYLGILSRCRVLVGNSSSGLIEAGFLNVDVIDVGFRQQGREHGANVVHADYGYHEIKRALARVLESDKSRRRPCRIYGDGKSAERIARILAEVIIDYNLSQKRIAY